MYREETIGIKGLEFRNTPIVVDMPAKEQVVDELDLQMVDKKLSMDLRSAAKSMSKVEVRYLCDLYYQIQKFRIQMGAQISSMESSGEPHSMHEYYFRQVSLIEKNICMTMKAYADNDPIGIWLQGNKGLGPVTSCVLLSILDIEKAPTAGHFHSLAGLDPRQVWYSAEDARKIVNKHFPGKDKDVASDEVIDAIAAETGKKLRNHLNNPNIARMILQKSDPDATTLQPTKQNLIRLVSMRPHHAWLKRTVWLIAGNLRKQGNPFYAPLMAERKAKEKALNESGAYAEQAEIRADMVGHNTIAYKYYSAGKLPDGHIDARVLRWGGKLFLSHLWEEMYRQKYQKEPPEPYVIAHLGHVHRIKHPGTTR